MAKSTKKSVKLSESQFSFLRRVYKAHQKGNQYTVAFGDGYENVSARSLIKKGLLTSATKYSYTYSLTADGISLAHDLFCMDWWTDLMLVINGQYVKEMVAQRRAQKAS